MDETTTKETDVTTLDTTNRFFSINAIVSEMISTALVEFDFEKNPALSRSVEKVFNNFDFSEEFSKLFKDMDMESEVRSVIDDYNFEDVITDVIDDYDFADKVESAIEDIDLESKVVDALENVNLDSKIETALESALDSYDFDQKIKSAIEDADIDGAIETALDDLNMDRKIEEAIGNLDLGTELRYAIKNSRIMQDYIEGLVDAQLRESDAIGRIIDERVAKALAERKPEPKFENLEKIDKLVTFLTQLFK